MIKKTLQYFDYGYYVRFAGMFLLFYLTYTFVISVSSPSGVYYPFVESYLNFPAVIRFCVLHVGQFLLSIFGYSTTVSGGRIFSEDSQNVLEMAFPCYGLGLKSFWVAFICAHTLSLKQKINWSILGVVTIFFLNSLRVTVMMVAMIDNWTIASFIGTNAHDLFNYICYAALLGLILLFYAKTKTTNSRKESPVLSA